MDTEFQECDLMSFLAAALNQINPKRERERRRKWMERRGEIFWAGRDGQSKNSPPNIFAIEYQPVSHASISLWRMTLSGYLYDVRWDI